MNADKSLDILIRTRAELDGAEAAAEAMERDIGKAKALGKDYSELDAQLAKARSAIDEFKQSEAASASETDQLSAATEKLTLKKADLKSMIKGAAAEFPLLANLGRLALNPITGAVAAITAGFSLWRRRIDETASALQSLELPDLSTNHIGMVSAAATAWQGYADAMTHAREQLSSVSTLSAQVAANIQQAAQHQQQLIAAVQAYAIARAQAEGRPTQQIDLDATAARRATEIQARRDQAANREREAQGLEAEAARKRAEAAGIGTASSAHDATMQGRLDDAAQTAKADREKQTELIGSIGTALTPGEPGRWVASLKLKMKQLLTGMSPDELLATARRQANSDLEIERIADRFRAQGPERDRERARRERLVSEATDAQTKADRIRSELPAERARIDADERANATVHDYERSTAEIQRQQEEARRAQEAERERERENERLNREGARELRDAYQNRGNDVSSAAGAVADQVDAMQRTVVAAFNALQQRVADARSRMDDGLNA